MNPFGAIPAVVTGITLVAFALSIGLYGYRARLSNRASVIDKVDPKDRLAAIEATAEYLRVDVSGISEKDKYKIVIKQIEQRSRRELMLALIALAIAILLSIVAVMSIAIEINPETLVVISCYKFDPQSEQQNKSIKRPCFPGKITFVKYWDSTDYATEALKRDPGAKPGAWPFDRPNRILQVIGLTGDGHTQWIEQDLTAVINGVEKWDKANHYWVSVVDNIGLGGGFVGSVLRRVDLEPIPLGQGATQCESEGDSRDVLEFSLPGNLIHLLEDDAKPTIGLRWVKVSCTQELGFNPLTGHSFGNTGWQIIRAFEDKSS